jgi:hypothetical protein
MRLLGTNALCHERIWISDAYSGLLSDSSPSKEAHKNSRKLSGEGLVEISQDLIRNLGVGWLRNRSVSGVGKIEYSMRVVG